MDKNVKFNSLSELLKEIDTWISLLNEKKNILQKVENTQVKVDEIHKVLNDEFARYVKENFHKDEKKKLLPISVNLNEKYYDKLVVLSNKCKQSKSTFLKNKYFDYIMEMRNNTKAIKSQFERYKQSIKDLTEKKKKKHSVALVLDDTDMSRLYDIQDKTGISPRDIVKLCLAYFVGDCDNGAVKEKKDFKIGKIDFIPCNSSNILGYSYNEIKQMLYIKFVGGNVYSYDNVPPQIYKDLCNADSKGKFVHENIAYEFVYKKVNQD